MWSQENYCVPPGHLQLQRRDESFFKETFLWTGLWKDNNPAPGTVSVLFLQGGAGRAVPEPFKWNPVGYLCIVQTKSSERQSEEVIRAWPGGTFSEHCAVCAYVFPFSLDNMFKKKKYLRKKIKLCDKLCVTRFNILYILTDNSHFKMQFAVNRTIIKNKCGKSEICFFLSITSQTLNRNIFKTQQQTSILRNFSYSQTMSLVFIIG